MYLALLCLPGVIRYCGCTLHLQALELLQDCLKIIQHHVIREALEDEGKLPIEIDPSMVSIGYEHRKNLTYPSVTLRVGMTLERTSKIVNATAKKIAARRTPKRGLFAISPKTFSE